MKVVISTHPNYHHPLKILLDSLNYTERLDDIVVCISDVPDNEAADTVAKYVDRYGLKHVLTHAKNIDEYTSYLSLGEALRKGQFPDDTHFLMIHDTCEAGRLFWDKLDELIAEVLGPRFEVMGETGAYKIVGAPIVHPISISDGSTLFLTFQNFVYTADKMLATFCMYVDGEKETGYVGYLAKDGRITQRRENALTFTSPDPKFINDTLEQKYLWFPVSTNFNIGVATREFVLHHASVKFASVSSQRFDKHQSIDVEINPSNPLNLQRQAGQRWRYTYCAHGNPTDCRIPTMSIWVNDTDVYHDGRKRNVSVIHPLDLKKYSILVGKAWAKSHPSRDVLRHVNDHQS